MWNNKEFKWNEVKDESLLYVLKYEDTKYIYFSVEIWSTRTKFAI